MAHYFKLDKEGIKGLLIVSGKVVDLDKFVKDSTKKNGLNMEEITQDEAEKEKNRLEL